MKCNSRWESRKIESVKSDAKDLCSVGPRIDSVKISKWLLPAQVSVTGWGLFGLEVGLFNFKTFHSNARHLAQICNTDPINTELIPSSIDIKYVPASTGVTTNLRWFSTGRGRPIIWQTISFTRAILPLKSVLLSTMRIWGCPTHAFNT